MPERLPPPAPERHGAPNDRERLAARVAADVERHRTHERRRRSPWRGLGTFGIVGWSVALPTLLGIAVGILIDRHAEGVLSWRLAGLLAGLALGVMNAWYWVSRESREDA